jgi:hypothetical protein
VRPDLLTVAGPRSALTVGMSANGQRVTSSAGNLRLGPMPGSSLAAGALLTEVPGSRRACWISSSCSLLSEVWSCLSPASTGTQGARCGGAGRDVIGASYVTSDQLKLAGSADRLAAAGGRQLAVSVFEVRLDRVDGDVHFPGGLSGAEQA